MNVNFECCKVSFGVSYLTPNSITDYFSSVKLFRNQWMGHLALFLGHNNLAFTTQI